MLTEVVVAIDGLSAEVAHESPAPARHAVAPLGLDQPHAAFVTLPDTGGGHLLLAGGHMEQDGGYLTIQSCHTKTMKGSVILLELQPKVYLFIFIFLKDLLTHTYKPPRVPSSGRVLDRQAADIAKLGR